MATFRVNFNDPNPIESVDAYWINLYDALDSLVKANTDRAPTSPTSPARSFSFIATTPAELPIKITVQAVKGGQPGPTAIYTGEGPPELAVSDIAVTVT